MTRLSLPYATLREVRRLVCSASLSKHLANVVDMPERADFYRSEARAFLVQARAIVSAAFKGVSDGDQSVSTPAAPSRLRLLCVLVPSGPYGSRLLPVHTMRAMPPRACVTGKWGLLGPSGFVLRETHARAPSAKVLVRCLRQRQANPFRANPRTVRTGGVMHG